MTELELRNKVVDVMRSWLGWSEANGKFRTIIDLYNTQRPLPRGYAVQYDDEWCATCVTAAGIQAGLHDIILGECGCGKMVELYRAAGRWEENDAYRPEPGDIIMYDWQDTGKGDNTGGADHVGIVEKVVGSAITVIEGNKGEAVARRTLAVNGRYIRGYCLPDYASKAEEDDDMDQTKFNEMFKTALAAHQRELMDNDCGEWSREAREWAISVGLFAGNGTTADGQPNYMWASPAFLSVCPAARAGVMSGGKRLAGGKSRRRPDLSQFSKWMIADIRPLLWIVTVGGLALAAYCVRVGYTGSLPWISAMVGLPWTAHGTVCAFYLNLCKSDHSEGGITYEAAKAANFNVQQEPEGSIDSPAI